MLLQSDRLPPQSLEVEEIVLGGILVDPNAISRVKEFLMPDDFYLAVHGVIYSSMLEVHRKGIPTDLTQVACHMMDRKLLDGVGGQFKLASLYDTTPNAVNIDLYAQVIKKKSIARSVIKVGRKISDQAHAEELETEELLNKVGEIYRSLNEHRGAAGSGLIKVSNSLADTFSEIERLSVAGVSPGLMSGFYDLDNLTSGFQNSDLIIIAGRPSMGKTAYATHMALKMAQAGHTVAFFSMEMSRQALIYRLISILARVESGRMKAGRIYDEEWDKLAKACATLSEIPFYIDSEGSLSVESIELRLEKLESQSGQKVDAVFIDYLQLMKGSSSYGNNKNQNQNQEVGTIVNHIKDLAMSRNIPIFTLSQLSRAVESRADKRPMLSDLRDSGNIEQAADLAMLMYRDEYYNKSTVDLGIAEILLSKHRNGPTGVVKLLFESKYTSFLNMAS